MLTYLLDTNVISELSKSRPNQNVEAAIQRYRDACALSAATVEELAFGVASTTLPPQRGRLEMWLEAMLTRFTVLAYDRECGLWLGRERARMRSAGRVLPRQDGQIAAVAAINKLILVTRNTRDFAHFSGVHVENWFED